MLFTVLRRTGHVLLIMLATAWLVTDRSWEPLLTCVTLLGLFIVDQVTTERAHTAAAPSPGIPSAKEATDLLSSPLAPTSLRPLPNVTSAVSESTLATLHQELGLRPLAVFESELVVERTPPGTYFFVSPFLLASQRFFLNLLREKALRSRSVYNNEFEVYRTVGGELSIVTYCGGAEAVLLSILDGKTTKQAVLSSKAWEHATNLLQLPADRVIAAGMRTLQTDGGDRITILDATVR